MDANITATRRNTVMPMNVSKPEASFLYPRHQWLGTESAAARRGAGVI
ncbi:hypothetical protein [Pseudactinotalea terrae]|nr:hypothetical protein [Pseudactinotalea terrae]